MQELRKDPIIGRWVIMATGRARRPGTFIASDKSSVDLKSVKKCQFCEEHEKETPKEIFAIRKGASKANTPGWQIRVVADKTPIFEADVKLSPKMNGLYEVLQTRGAHEIVDETPEHIANMADLDVKQIKQVIEVYAERIRDLEKDASLCYALAHKNYNWSRDNQNIPHAHSQIIATPVIPMRIREELKGAQKYYDYHERCIFCDLIKQELNDRSRVVVESDHFLVIVPFASRFPFEMWILPKKHHAHFWKGVVGQEQDLAKILKEALLRLKLGVSDPAYHYVIHTAPFIRKTGERIGFTRIEEDYHWHIEIIPRLTHTAGFEKGTGFYICPIPPEEAAGYLRGVEI